MSREPEFLVSFNVNGLRAVVKKDLFYPFLDEYSPDVLCLQETKLQEGQISVDAPDYNVYFNCAQRKGYSGTAVFLKKEFEPLSLTYGLGIPEHDTEGRVISVEFDSFYLVTVYTPNSGDGLKRLAYRMEWEDAFKAYLKGLEEKKPVIICGDLNVAHKEIDLKNPSSNHKNPGFTDEEREKFTALLDSGFTDTFRHFYPDMEGAYSWWSYRFHARENNAGWRIDYFLVSDMLKGRLKDALILNEVYGSDHCPVALKLS